ncbi:tape measure domain-containing protein [Aliihoeflea sp. 2WW]|uniref:tape measure protein n=1 Tax=Aliihoeflea sp. 2WW TaxID=1381123 RepID=UPI000467A046|nr:tape measure domain-containing protein [Aliihoeflea sp. 2WW]
MAVTLDELKAVMRMEMKPFMRDLQKMHGVNGQAARRVEQTWMAANRRLDGIGKNMAQSLIAPLAGIGAALGARELVRLTDTWTDLNSRVRLAAGGMEEGAQVMERLGDVARRTYSSLEQTAEGYLLNSTAMRELGYSTNQTLNYTEAVNNALVISGAKGQRAASVMDALAKAMALGELRGDNLNTVIQSGGRVAEALAEGLGVGVNQLRALGQQGKITGRDVVRALSSQMERLRKEAEAMPATISDGIQLLQNAMLEYVGKGDQAVGVSAKISEALVIMADNFDSTADVALQLAAVIAGALVGRSLLRMISTLGLASTALINFTRALTAARTMAGLSLAFTGLGAAAGPVGLLIGGAVVASLVSFSESSEDAAIGARTYAEALEEVRARAKEVAPAVENMVPVLDEKIKNSLTRAVEDAASKVEGLMGEMQKEIGDLAATFENMADIEVVSPDQLAQLIELKNRLAANPAAAKEVELALFALANANPRFQTVADRVGVLTASLIEALAVANLLDERLAQSGLQETGLRRRQEDGQYRIDREAAAQFEKEQLRRAQLGKDQLALENEIARVRKQALDDGVKLTEQQIARIAEANLAGNASRSDEGKKPKKEAKERADEYERLAQRISDSTAAMISETEVQRQLNPLVEDYGYAIEKARAELDLLNAAKEAGVEITPQLRSEISALADQFATATVEAAKLGETQDDIRRKAQEMSDFQKDLSRGIVDGFMQGKRAADIFSDALSKISSKLLDMAFDGLFDTKSGGGGFGGIFGAIGKAIGFRKDGGRTGTASFSTQPEIFA